MDFINDFLKKHCKRRHRDREISLTDRKMFYDLLIAGNIEDFKREFNKKVTEKNFPALKFSNVFFLHTLFEMLYLFRKSIVGTQFI